MSESKNVVKRLAQLMSDASHEHRGIPWLREQMEQEFGLSFASHLEACVTELETQNVSLREQADKLRTDLHTANMRISELLTREAVVDARAMALNVMVGEMQSLLKRIEGWSSKV